MYRNRLAYLLLTASWIVCPSATWAENPVTEGDLFATIYQTLGINHRA